MNPLMGYGLPLGFNRRDFLRIGFKTVAGAAIGTAFFGTNVSFAGQTAKVTENTGLQKTFIPPLFCTAYITPDAPGQGGQEAIVARYPMALVPQDIRPQFRKWRDRVKRLNPNIVLLGYQMVIQETSVPGPGHDQLRKAKEAWSTYPGGIFPRIFDGSMQEGSRIYDPRSLGWQEAFLEACRKTLASYPYNGLFLDMCDVVVRAHPFPWVREEMRAALQSVLLQLRKEFPHAILVGNSSQSYAGLNGEMNEGRPDNVRTELAQFEGHAQPRVELIQTRLQRADNIETVKRDMAVAHAYNAFYGAAVDYQHVLWFDVFDDVIASYVKA